MVRPRLSEYITTGKIPNVSAQIFRTSRGFFPAFLKTCSHPHDVKGIMKKVD
jgi:hypothetical protein